MTSMPFRRPAIKQQFVPRDATSAYDCAATAGAAAADADSRGKYATLTHSQVRRNTNEPRPNPDSPGLTIHQVADSLQRLTHGEVVIDVYGMGSPFGSMIDALQQGKWAIIAVWRGVQVDAGWGGNSPFRGGHGELYGYDQDNQDWLLMDPLIPRWLHVPPSTVERMCRQFLIAAGGGVTATGAYYGLTRDVYNEPDDGDVAEDDDVSFNIGPVNTHRDAVLKPNTTLYSNSGLTKRQSHSNTSAEQAFGFVGSTPDAHVIVNGGNTVYVRRADVVRIVNYEREFE